MAPSPRPSPRKWGEGAGRRTNVAAMGESDSLRAGGGEERNRLLPDDRVRAGRLPPLIRQGVPFRPFRNIFGHEKVAYGDPPIELAEVGGAREFSQLVVFDRFFPVMRRFSLRPAYWVLRPAPHANLL
jgi:hypothetical protein